MKHQRWNVNAGEVLAEILPPRGHAGQAGSRRGLGGNVPARLYRLFADAFPEKNIGVVEILEELSEESVAVLLDGLLNGFKDCGLHPLRVVGGFPEERR